ncbi:MAG: ExbD/TolR family protein [Verrucomicrobiota bacterium]
MKRRVTSSDSEISDINISPLIDMVFILLIFFIVAAVFVEEPGVEIQREVTVTGDDLEKNAIIFAITPDGQVVYGGEDVGVIGVRGVVNRISQARSMPVVLQVDQNADAATLVRVIEEVNIADAQAYIATDEP